MNSACAEVLACGQNTRTAQTRRPAVRGPSLVRHLYFADKTKIDKHRQGLVDFYFFTLLYSLFTKTNGSIFGT